MLHDSFARVNSVIAVVMGSYIIGQITFDSLTNPPKRFEKDRCRLTRSMGADSLVAWFLGSCLTCFAGN